MAQTMLITPSVSGHSVLDLKRQPLLQRLRPKPFSHLLLPPLPTSSSTSSPAFTTLALFKSKTKAAPPKKVTKPKPQVEDGIFGTSGGIGFTKKNELFVGRVAMLALLLVLKSVESKLEEMIDASLLGEAITGKGILAQLNLETGIPIYEAEPLLLFFILFTLLGAIGALGDRGRFVDDDPPTGIEGAVIPPGKGLRSALGLREGVGHRLLYNWRNNYREGALAQLNIETGVPISDIEPLVLFNVIFFFFAALNPGSGKFVTDDEEE
ncbi:Photosystem II 22 kDa protein, chloroplastic [Vitis vinifera]|uniref:Photosystem II 22 kDa protein, chloroplastic n=1 Tax=Vitis vinifera TaxID=29760 RepID=A0A438KMF3_VITVI|nr:Photosystem II 22 kDa protein, chloroplastic [Vitis vinifera]